MLRCLLDTSTVIAFMKGDPGVVARIQSVEVGHLALCAPVVAELWYGVARSDPQRREHNRHRLDLLLQGLPCLPLAGESARRCGELRAQLTGAGTPIGPYDVQIAAIALTEDLTVVTRNLREFERVPGLRVENWIGG